MAKSKEFVMSDESPNHYGFRVLTSGIKLQKFLRNPVMFYNHQREKGIIGRWENVRVEGDKLIGTPVFDESDKLGRKISKKVEGGFVRAASIGIESITADATGEVMTSCELVECSICDIPANENALVLYHQGEPVKDKESYVKLNLVKTQNPMNEQDVLKIIEALGLKPGASLDDILAAIESLSGETPKAVVENAIKMNFVKPYEKDNLLKMARKEPGAFAKYINDRKVETMKERRAEALELINAAFADGRLIVPDSVKARAFWLNAFESDFEGSKAALHNMNKRVALADMIKNKSNMNDLEDRSTWRLNDYRKKAPKELAANPELYQRLIEEEKNLKTPKNS